MKGRGIDLIVCFGFTSIIYVNVVVVKEKTTMSILNQLRVKQEEGIEEEEENGDEFKEEVFEINENDDDNYDFSTSDSVSSSMPSSCFTLS